ncbi:MAG TPA: efflux RND transporter periplasmic adaptor subunit [Isosphaeraceae bacterium]|nr:efflux RND transporter periplasmic adaptor subunit [Isosphaeraceae bacterium]
MNPDQRYDALFDEHGESRPVPSTPTSGPSATAAAPRRRMGFGQRLVVGLLLTVVLVPPLAGFYSYFSGVPLHLLASKKEVKETLAASAAPSVSLVSGQAHTLSVSWEVATALGIRKGQSYSVAIAQAPTMMRPLVLPGSMRLDPARLDRIKARFAPARVVELAQVQDRSPKTGYTEYRDLRPGDIVSKGELLGVFYSVDVGSRKNDLLDALVQLELDQKILDEAQKHREAIPQVFMMTYDRAVQGDRNAVNRALNNLKLWDIPQDEIDALHAEAIKISSDKNAWLKTPEGRWVKGEKQATGAKVYPHNDTENPWGRVTLRADLGGVVIECNVRTGEMVVDNTVNLFQIADVSRLQVIANCPEDALPILEALDRRGRKWTVRTVGTAVATGLPGTIDEIGYVIDPNQHTAVIKGYVDNPGQRIRAGQYVTATVNIPPPDDVVEIPIDALEEDGRQSLVFVQRDAATHHFTMRRVQVTNRFERTVFVRDKPMPNEEQLTTQDKEEGLLPIEVLRPGERVLLSGAVELKAALLDLESRPAKKSKAGQGLTRKD